MGKVDIDLGNGKHLIAEAGKDPSYPREIFVYQQNADGTQQDIAYIGQDYVPASDPAEYADGVYRVMTADKDGNFEWPNGTVRLPDPE